MKAVVKKAMSKPSAADQNLNASSLDSIEMQSSSKGLSFL